MFLYRIIPLPCPAFLLDRVFLFQRLNAILHEYSSYILGRMGIPYQKRNLSIISIVIDAPQNVISALSGKLGMIPDVRTKTVYSKV